MMQLVAPEYYGSFVHELAEMHRLRYRVFKERLDWNIEVTGDMEVDEFDVLRPVHLLNRSEAGHIQGCVRLLPSNGPAMLRDNFPVLLDGQPAPRSHRIWEGSRFSLDIPVNAPKASGGVAAVTYELFAGMIEFGLSIDLIEIVTVADARMERILRRAGWPIRRMGKARPLGNTTAVAGYLEVSSDALERIRKAGHISGPVLWPPVLHTALGSWKQILARHR
ncbi:acyl-homoserine-lactone synthase [Bradyrhizobium yuanmingense]|uniref:acyl-homoserine-lactone synthase n=1 Tax=Bradyrhizobium yuanmingense TaxID=108015 RepID=UPI0023B9EFDD|nr:acyl-homoserine-lactone synthase [Bradyrhizobium yuanmingense]MDF0498663.1 acyl-homoserine-lactone synthase [Bradyrhizobium yuanmingense]